jgi:hypothetical protein
MVLFEFLFKNHMQLTEDNSKIIKTKQIKKKNTFNENGAHIYIKIFFLLICLFFIILLLSTLFWVTMDRQEEELFHPSLK